jgi:iron complex outermembrane receptor protein
MNADRMNARILAGALLTIGVLVAAPQLAASGQDTEADNRPGEKRESQEAAAQEVFRGTITVEDSPIVEGSKIDSFGSLVTTVGEQQIEDLYAQDLTSALRRVPGVVISRYNPIGAFGGGDGGAFFIRGHGSGRPGSEIVMLTDGIPRFVGVWTHPLIDVANIDTVHSIDIYRSAQPVMIGNMAFGAIDMSTPRRTAAGSGGRFTGSYGSFDTLIGNLEYGGRGEVIDYYVSASHRRSEGHRDNADGEITAASGRLGFQLSDVWNLSIFYEHTSSAVNDPRPVGAPPIPIVPNYDIGNDFVLATVGHDHKGWSGTIKLYFDSGTFDWLQWSAAEQHEFQSITDSTNYGVRWRENLRPWDGGELVLGLDYDIYGGEFVERHPNDDRLANDLEFRNTAPYVMLNHTFGDEVTVTPTIGVRYNDSRYFGSEWGTQAGINVGVADQMFYANYAHGFNLPGVWAAVQYSGWGRGDQWQDLEAETIDHFEIGWLGSLGRSLRMTASIYRDEVDNAIRFVPPPPPPPLFANIGAYTVNGIEISLQAEPTDRLALFLAGTYSDADPDTVPNLPKGTAVGGASWTGRSGWRCNLDLQWVDERFILNPRFAPGQVPVDAYFLANAKLSLPWRLLGIDVEGSLFVFGENLLDEEYQHRLGYPMPGAMVQVGVDFGF